jgi:hypothetical protein
LRLPLCTYSAWARLLSEVNKTKQAAPQNEPQGTACFQPLLQVFDGSASYFILSRGEAVELNPFVGGAIEAWGLTGGLIYWKVIVCALLVLLYQLARYQPTPPRIGLTFVAIVYSALGFYLTTNLFHLV